MDKISQLHIVDMLAKPFSIVHLPDLLRHSLAMAPLSNRLELDGTYE